MESSISPAMSEEGRSPLRSFGDDDISFPFYKLGSGRRKYQQRRLKPQMESLDKELASSAGRPTGRTRKRFVGVRQRSSGRWVAEIKDTTQKIRLWLGTFDTAEDAARAYDEAACMLRGVNTRTNFLPSASSNGSVLPSKAARTLIQHLNSNSSSSSSAAKDEDQNQLPSSPSAAYTNDMSQFQGSEYLEEDEEHSFVKAEPLHVQSFTSLLPSPDIRYDEGKSLEEEFPVTGRRERADETKSSFSSFETGFSSMDHPLSVAGYLSAEGVKDQHEVFPDSSIDLGDTLSALGDLIHSAESVYTSLFDFSAEIPMPSCKFDDEDVSAYDLAEREVIAETEEGSMLREQIRRFNFERISSASLYAMNGVQELCLLKSGESSSYCLTSPSLGRSPPFRGQRSPFASSWKMLSSPSWLPRQSSSGSSPVAHKTSEYQNQDTTWGANWCRVPIARY